MSAKPALQVIESRFPVEKGVPMPIRGRNGKGRAPIYPWLSMELGDSFFVNIGDNSNKTQGRISAACWKASQHLGMKFTTRQVTENGVKVIRVWRVA